MTKKEEQPTEKPEENRERERTKKNMEYNPDITREDKNVLNNQSAEEQKDDYYKNRKRPVDYEGEDLDIPDIDQHKFNDTASKPDDSGKGERSKKSANSNDNIETDTQTIYKGKKTEKYKDPSKK